MYGYNFLIEKGLLIPKVYGNTTNKFIQIGPIIDENIPENDIIKGTFMPDHSEGLLEIREYDTIIFELNNRKYMPSNYQCECPYHSKNIIISNLITKPYSTLNYEEFLVYTAYWDDPCNIHVIIFLRERGSSSSYYDIFLDGKNVKGLCPDLYEILSYKIYEIDKYKRKSIENTIISTNSTNNSLFHNFKLDISQSNATEYKVSFLLDATFGE